MPSTSEGGEDYGTQNRSCLSSQMLDQCHAPQVKCWHCMRRIATFSVLIHRDGLYLANPVIGSLTFAT